MTGLLFLRSHHYHCHQYHIVSTAIIRWHSAFPSAIILGVAVVAGPDIVSIKQPAESTKFHIITSTHQQSRCGALVLV